MKTNTSPSPSSPSAPLEEFSKVSELNVLSLRPPARSVEDYGDLSQHVPVICLHGWRHSLWNLKPLGELLAPYTEVHLIDLPGYGESTGPGENWGTKEYAEKILEFMRSNDGEK